MKTRFSRDLAGEFGEFWRKDAEKRIADMQRRAEAGEIDFQDGVAKWKSSGWCLPEECVEMLLHTTFSGLVDPEKMKKAEAEETAETIRQYRERNKGRKRSPEELAEMRAAFGAGAQVMDVLTGDVIVL